jgi:hypothetical protein
MFAAEAVVVAYRMFSIDLAKAIVIGTLAQPVMRILSAETLVVAIGMIAISLTEAIVIGLLAQPMPRVPVAEAHQGDELGAQPVLGMPATKWILLGEPRQDVRAAPTMGVKQHPDGDVWRRRNDEPGTRGRRGQGQDADHDAEQQRVADRAKNNHVRLSVEVIINQRIKNWYLIQSLRQALHLLTKLEDLPVCAARA